MIKSITFPYITLVPFSSPLSDQFPADHRGNLYIVAIGNEEPATAQSAVNMLKAKQHRARTAKLHMTLAIHVPSSLTTLDEHRAFMDQARPLIQPSINRHEVFSLTKPTVPPHFGAALAGPDRNDWIRGAYAKYDKNAQFGLLTAPFPRDDLPKETKGLSLSHGSFHQEDCGKCLVLLPASLRKWQHPSKGD